jgi:hypothetical protein
MDPRSSGVLGCDRRGASRLRQQHDDEVGHQIGDGRIVEAQEGSGSGGAQGRTAAKTLARVTMQASEDVKKGRPS